MDISEFILPTAIATSVATVITALFQTYLSSRTAHDFARLLEEHKTELAERLAARSRLMERRLLAYPQLVELIYRARNIARDLVTTSSPILTREFAARRREIENAIYKYRIDLERDQLFELTHDFKNLLAVFANAQASDQGDPGKLRSLYESIEAAYRTIVARISAEAGA
jgi:hypothetical protein